MSAAPVTVFWDHTVVAPANNSDETTLVLCKSEDGQPVTLSLTDGARRSLALKLIDPDGACGHIARLAFLRHEIGKLHTGERLTTKRAARLYTKAGYPAGNQQASARRDLATLHREGLLVQHDEDGVRFYTRRVGGGDSR